MITRRTFLCGLTLGTLAAPLAAEAQQAEKVYRIGLLGTDRTLQETRLGALRAGLRELGYVEGKNIGLTIPQSVLGRADQVIV